MHIIQHFLRITLLSLIPVFAAAQDLLIGNVDIDINQTADIYSADIMGSVHFDADTKTLTLNNATLTNVLIQNNNVTWLNICLKGENHITNKSGALFLLRPTKITGDGSLSTSCDMDYSDIYHESSLLVEDCTIDVGIFRGVFNAFLEIRNASVTSLHGIYWHSGVALKDCKIVQPVGGVYDENEHAVSLHGWIYKGKVVIERIKPLSIDRIETNEEERMFFDMQGRLLSEPYKGICIIRYADGRVKKVMR